MYFIGIDPGIEVSAICCVFIEKNGRVNLLDVGSERTDSSKELWHRVWQIYAHIEGFMRFQLWKGAKQPYVVCEQYFNKSFTHAGNGIQMAIGAIYAAVVNTLKNIPCNVGTINPRTSKRFGVGNGRADKQEIQRVLAEILSQGLPQSRLPKNEHEWDAVLHAVAYHNKLCSEGMFRKN